MRANFYTSAFILPQNLSIFQCILWQPLIEDISKFPTLEIKSKIKIQGKLIFFHTPNSETTHIQKILSKLELMSETSLKIDLNSSQKTQRSELISSPTGWFVVVSYLISDDKRAVDRQSTLRHPIFRSLYLYPEKLWKLHSRTIQKKIGILSRFLSFHR